MICFPLDAWAKLFLTDLKTIFPFVPSVALANPNDDSIDDVSSPAFNCLLSTESGDDLLDEKDVEADPDWDVYDVLPAECLMRGNGSSEDDEEEEDNDQGKETINGKEYMWKLAFFYRRLTLGIATLTPTSAVKWVLYGFGSKFWAALLLMLQPCKGDT